MAQARPGPRTLVSFVRVSFREAGVFSHWRNVARRDADQAVILTTSPSKNRPRAALSSFPYLVLIYFLAARAGLKRTAGPVAS